MADASAIGDVWRVTIEQAEGGLPGDGYSSVDDGVAYVVAPTASEAAEIIEGVWSAPRGGIHRVKAVEVLGACWRAGA